MALEHLLICAGRNISAPVQRAAVLAAAQNRARDLANTPANELTPAALSAYAEQLAHRHGAISVDVLDGREIRARGMGAFAAIAQSSTEDARLIELRYEDLLSCRGWP